MNRILSTAVLASGLLLAGCKDDSSPSGNPSGAPAGPNPAPAANTQPAAAAPVATTRATDSHDHPAGPKEPLGTKSVAGYELKAFQAGPIKEGDLDLAITGGPGKPKAVRFWVGVESAEGSAKAKAEEETPGTWHVHPEVPDPLPPGSQFWAEVESPAGERFKVSFDLKR